MVFLDVQVGEPGHLGDGLVDHPIPCHWRLNPAVLILLLAHWTTFLMSVSSDSSLMHPGCRQVTALLA